MSEETEVSWKNRKREILRECATEAERKYYRRLWRQQEEWEASDKGMWDEAMWEKSLEEKK